MTRIKAAITAGVRPCAVVFREQPRLDWTDMDFKLLEAYQTLQDEICPQCGFPVWQCRSTDDRFAWHTETSVCYATRAREEAEWRNENGSKSPSQDERKSWGRFTYASPKLAGHYDEDTDLPTRREFYENGR